MRCWRTSQKEEGLWWWFRAFSSPVKEGATCLCNFLRKLGLLFELVVVEVYGELKSWKYSFIQRTCHTSYSVQLFQSIVLLKMLMHCIYTPRVLKDLSHRVSSLDWWFEHLGQDVVKSGRQDLFVSILEWPGLLELLTQHNLSSRILFTELEWKGIVG